MNDSDNVPYFEDGTERTLRYLRDNLPDFKAFMEGDPIAIPTSLMPCVCVQKLSGQTLPSATGTNDILETILVKVILNKKDDYGSQASLPNIDLTERKLRRIVAGRDSTTGMYMPHSVFGILSTNITLGNQVLGMDLKDEYDVDVRPSVDKEEATVISVAYVTLTLKMRVIVNPRS